MLKNSLQQKSLLRNNQQKNLNKELERFSNKLSDQRSCVIAKMVSGDSQKLLQLVVKDWFMVARYLHT